MRLNTDPNTVRLSRFITDACADQRIGVEIDKISDASAIVEYLADYARADSFDERFSSARRKMWPYGVDSAHALGDESFAVSTWFDARAALQAIDEHRRAEPLAAKLWESAVLDLWAAIDVGSLTKGEAIAEWIRPAIGRYSLDSWSQLTGFLHELGNWTLENSYWPTWRDSTSADAAAINFEATLIKRLIAHVGAGGAQNRHAALRQLRTRELRIVWLQLAEQFAKDVDRTCPYGLLRRLFQRLVARITSRVVAIRSDQAPAESSQTIRQEILDFRFMTGNPPPSSDPVARSKLLARHAWVTMNNRGLYEAVRGQAVKPGVFRWIRQRGSKYCSTQGALDYFTSDRCYDKGRCRFFEGNHSGRAA